MKLIILLIASILICNSYSVQFWDSMQFNQVRSTEEPLIHSPIFAQIKQTYDTFVKSPTKSNYTIPPKGSLIPPTIHFIWLGSDLPPEAGYAIDSWKKWHPGWEIKVWKDNDLINFQWTTPRSRINFYEATSYAEKADILRLEVLYQFGGIYSDTDVICLKPFHDLVTSGFQFFAGIEVNWVSKITKNPLHVGTAILGSVQGSQTVKYCLDNHQGIKEAPDVHLMNRTGPGLCSRAVIQSMAKGEKILLLPVSYFYPFPYEARHLPFEQAMTYQAPETMALHLWSATWLPKEVLEKDKQESIARGYSN